MNKYKAFKLAKALESGKYKQGKEYLKQDDSYCCLGVACVINNVEYSNYGCDFLFDGHYQTLSKNAQEKTGINSSGGEFKKSILVKRLNGKTQRFYLLSDMNDEGLSFKFIAKILRKHYKNII